MSGTSTTLTIEPEENELPTAIAVEETKLLQPEYDVDYYNYLVTHQDKLHKIREAVKWILRNQFERRRTRVMFEHKTTIGIKELFTDKQSLCYYERFVFGLYDLHKEEWFSQKELGLIDDVILNFRQTTEADKKLVVCATIFTWDTWDTCEIITIHLCCCFCLDSLLKYYKS